MRVGANGLAPAIAALRPATAALAALVLVSSSPLPLPAATPTTEELSRLTSGLSRIDYLLDNWDELVPKSDSMKNLRTLMTPYVVRGKSMGRHDVLSSLIIEMELL